MTGLDLAREQLDTAADLSAILDAAHTCFTTMLAVIEHQQDPGNPLFEAFVMAGAAAASGRFAVVAAPSLTTPAAELAPSSDAETSAGNAALALGHLAEVLDRRLRAASQIADDAADRQACAAAARNAADLAALFGRTPRL
jgi:hypothetical protein